MALTASQRLSLAFILISARRNPFPPGLADLMEAARAEVVEATGGKLRDFVKESVDIFFNNEGVACPVIHGTYAQMMAQMPEQMLPFVKDTFAGEATQYLSQPIVGSIIGLPDNVYPIAFGKAPIVH